MKIAWPTPRVGGSLAWPSPLTATTARHDGAPGAFAARCACHRRLFV
jgi:hypothetical protein